MISQPLPYGLDAPVFRFRALATLAGRTTLGADREVALGCFMAARLASGLLDPVLPSPGREARSAAARGWYAGLALPSATRVPFARLVDAAAGEDRFAAAEALRKVLEITSTYLDAASRLELERLAQTLSEGN